jgi:RNA polymerase sigma-70 factor (ECF subfamily)
VDGEHGPAALKAAALPLCSLYAGDAPIRGTPTNVTTVTPLLPRIAEGDRNAIRECIARYGGLVWSLARRAAHNDAEDAVQEIFLDLWKSAARFDESAGSEITFVAMIARRRLVDRRRQSQRRPETESLGDSSSEARAVLSTSAAPEMGAEAALAARALDQLKPEQRQVLILTTCHGLSHEEVATSTGMPLGTVKAHARRGLIRVREALGELPIGGTMEVAR